MTRWDESTRIQYVQFEWGEELQLRPVRLIGASARVGDPVRVAVASVEVEGRIDSLEGSMLYVRVGGRLF